MKHQPSTVTRVARWIGVELSELTTQRLRRYADWLVEEALPAGGIGPEEIDRIWDRHIADSLLFSEVARPGESVLDVGTGVGLPAIPLAIVHSETSFVAADRSGRRTDLVNRAVRILGLENVDVRQADVVDLQGRFGGMTSRAVASADRVAQWAQRLLAPGGIALVAHSRTGEAAPVIAVAGLDVSVVEVPHLLLDADLTLLRMVRRVDH